MMQKLKSWQCLYDRDKYLPTCRGRKQKAKRVDGISEVTTVRVDDSHSQVCWWAECYKGEKSINSLIVRSTPVVFPVKIHGEEMTPVQRTETFKSFFLKAPLFYLRQQHLMEEVPSRMYVLFSFCVLLFFTSSHLVYPSHWSRQQFSASHAVPPSSPPPPSF